MGLRGRTTASAAAAAGVATLMTLAGCGGGGSPTAGGPSGGADALTSASGGPTTAANTSGAGSPATGGGSPATATGDGNGSGNAAIGPLPYASLTGAVGASIATACKDADTAWSTFQSAYGAATTNPKKAVAAATGASTLADIVHNLVQAVARNDPTASYLARAQDVERGGTTVSKDLGNLSHHLQADDANTAAMLYSSSNPLTPVQLDEVSFKSACGI